MNRKVLEKLCKIFMVVMMVFSMISSTNQPMINAWDNSIPHEFTRIKSIKYPEWWGRKIASLKQWSTYSCKYNGQWSYCLESSKKTPSSGNYTAQVIENNANVRKLLYYGFGGPGATDVFAADRDLKKIVCPDDSYLSNDDVKYLLTHIFLSGAYSGDWNGFSEELFNQAFGGTYGTNLMNIYHHIISLPDPDNGANFSTGDIATFKANYDEKNNLQTTNVVKFNAASHESVKLPLQENVTIHIVGSSKTQTGGLATVYGGQSFYLTTPVTNALDNYQSGTLTSSAKGKFCALAILPAANVTQSHGSWYQESANALKYKVDWLSFGNIELKKKSKNEAMTSDSSLYSLKGAEYGIYSGDELVEKLITDENGYAKSSLIREGNYTIKEISASNGYDIDQQVYHVTVVKGKTATVNVTESPKNDPIGIEIVKNDATKSSLQGDASLAGAEFEVNYYDSFYTKDQLPEKATRTWLLKTIEVTDSTGQKRYMAGLGLPGSVIKDKSDALYVDENGRACLPLGTISIEEKKAPQGYFKEGARLTVTDTATGNVSEVVDGKFVSKITEEYQGAKLQFGNSTNQMVVYDRLKQQRIRIFKSGEREGISGVVKGLQGAEFTWKLKSEVDHVGWDQAQTYAIITTDENGHAITGYLPYGNYLVRETKTPKEYMTAPDFTVAVTKDASEYNELEQVKLVNVNNRPFASYVKLIKVDEETGKKVTLNSASFKIKDAKGNYVVQKVSGKKVDTFTTNSDNEIVPLVDKGTVTLPLMLDAGEYFIEEIKTPKGFLNMENQVRFIISNIYDYSKDEDAHPLVEVIIKNKQPKSEIKLNKTLADLKTDVDLVNRTDLSKIQFVLKAKKEVISAIDGSVIFKKDEIISSEKSGAIVKAGSELGKGIYALSKEGNLLITNLPMGSYYLQEVKTLDGCVLDSTHYEATFKQADHTTKTYLQSLNVHNETTHFEFNKTDITGDKEVKGATLIIKDDNGNVVDQWVSTDKPHSIEGLVVGKTYTLIETVTAKDYVKATNIKFTVKNSSELETITMKDKQVSFTKTDVTGEKEVEGATITVTDKETGKVVDQWTSTKEKHFMNGLEEGKTYILSEIVTPEEYVKATNIEFTVSKEKVNEKIKMKDKQVKISKLTVGGKEVTGALMQILDEKGNIVDEWYSEGKYHFANNLEEGRTYTLHEDLSPIGLNLANDFNFEVTKEKKNQTVEMIDTLTEVEKTDVDGKFVKDVTLSIVSTKTKQIVDQWVTGQHIIDLDKDVKAQLEEKGKAEGSYMNEEDSMVTFSISKNKDRDDYTLMQVVDGVTTYANIDLKGNETTHRVQGLIAGEDYILRETKTPEEYVTAKEIEFTVKTDKDEKLVMKDKQVTISKITVGGKEVTGALMQIKDEDGNVVDEWTSEGKVHLASGLVEGKKYTLHEDLAPTGLNLANDIEFEVTYDKENQKVEMTDTMTEVDKTDVDGKFVKGATLSIVSTKTKQIVDQWVTGQHIIDLDKDVKAQLEEKGKAEGSYMNEEDSMVTFSISKNKDRDDYTLMQVVNGVTTYANIDLKGNETTHRVQGLIVGEDYILRETKTPEEYVTAKEMAFTAKEDADEKLVMKDKQVIISKITVGGKEVTGALMQIKDEDGNIIDEWTSEGKVHLASGLVEGKKYTLHEDLAPTGLNLANDVEFEVTYDKENQKVEMIDTINEVSKVDEKGNLLKGAEMTVTSNKTKNIIDKWVSGQHIFDITKDMKADLTKNGKSEGMYESDNSTVTYSLTANKDRKDYTLMLGKDGKVTYTNVDINGDETSHMIQGLEAGEEYVLKETKTPDGYATFKEQVFTAKEDKDTSLKVVDEDTKVEVSKQDITTKKELEGAKLKVTDKDGKVIDEWTSGKQPHMIKNLTAGEAYTLTEVTAPKGYQVSEKVEFKVKDTGKIQRVIMYDQPVKKVKTGDRNTYYFEMLIISLLGIYLLRKRLNNFIN